MKVAKAAWVRPLVIKISSGVASIPFMVRTFVCKRLPQLGLALEMSVVDQARVQCVPWLPA